jgi:DNA-binding Xre family transcriptional regulator
MVKLQIRQTAKRNGITNAYQLQKVMEIQPAMAARLWKGDMKMIALNTLDALCESLDCELDELIVRVVRKRKSRRGSPQ